MTKTCSLCHQTKPLTEFYKHKSGTPFAGCKPCQNKKSTDWARNNRAKANALTRDWCRRNPDYTRRKWLKRYGLSPEEYDALLASQDGKCAICRKVFSEKRNLHIDHCHKTGRVRGLLCTNCNLGIGNMQEDPVRLVSALLYLQSHYNG